MGMASALDFLAAQHLGNDGQDEWEYRQYVENQPDPPGKAFWVSLRRPTITLTPTSESS